MVRSNRSVPAITARCSRKEQVGDNGPELVQLALVMLEKYEGAHIVAFGSGEAEIAYNVLSQRLNGVQPARRQNDAAFGVNDEETRRAAFNNITVDPAIFPEAKLIFMSTRPVMSYGSRI